MATDLQNEINDVGRGTDKPKGFVKLALIGMASAIVSLGSFAGVLFRINIKQTNQCSMEKERIMAQTQKSIDEIRVEYYKKLEDRMNRLENVEQRVDSLPQKK